MHHNLALLTNITVALLAAFAGGYLARRVGLPSLVGYLLAGMAIGPFTPGFVGEIEDISQLAEMGVIFMMFGVGLHFSLKDLWRVRQIAIPGAILQMLIATGLGFLLTQLWGWSIGASLVLGLAISIASTVVLLRGLMDNGLLSTQHGQVAVGWLVLEDLATVAILVLLPAVLGNSGNPWQTGGLAIINTTIFVGLMLIGGTKVMPWLLTQIAHTRSRELFILAVVAVALGTALGAADLFGVSLALGAFLAGVVIGESEVSHQVGAEVLPFRDIFAVLFFVSVGMLVNPVSLWANAGQVVALSFLIIVGKAVFTLLLGLVLPASGRTMLVVAVGLSQIGEFSFIVGQAGLSLGVIDQAQYGLILAGALLSIVVNPLLFKAIPPLEQRLQQLPVLWNRLQHGEAAPQASTHSLENHVVVVGYGRVGEHIVTVLERLTVPYLVVERDAAQATEFQKRGISTLFGDAANSEILTHTGLEHARALVVTIPDETAAELIVITAHDLAPSLPIIARAATQSGVRRLTTHGARAVIHPEFEGGLEVVRHTLLALEYPMGQVQQYIDAVRDDAYDTSQMTPAESKMLDQLVAAVRGMSITWQSVEEHSPLAGRTLVQANLRAETGASVIAIVRNQQVITTPAANMKFIPGDLVGLIGNTQQVEAAARYINPPLANSPHVNSAAAEALATTSPRGQG
ncbi:MAG: cation:proton antiporter [Caldilineaceae bacterium]|nr:cation:proton antiporter [Caldilineaceae bacterium]